MVHYLLPCQCGRKIPVDTTKAGRTIECECGAKLEVPTLGGLKKLEQLVEAKRTGSAATWGPRQRVFLVGILIFSIGLGITGYFWHGRPQPPQIERRLELIPERIESLSLMQTLVLWGQLERGLPEYSSREYQDYLEKRGAYFRRTGVTLFIAAAGLLVMIISLFIPKKHGRHRPRI